MVFIPSPNQKQILHRQLLILLISHYVFDCNNAQNPMASSTTEVSLTRTESRTWISNWSHIIRVNLLWASYQICKIAGCASAGNAGNVFPPPRVSDPEMHHGTCVTQVPWCMPGSLTSGFIWSRLRGKRARHSRRMRNPQFSVSGKRPITHQCPNFNGVLAKPLKLGHGWVITSHRKQWCGHKPSCWSHLILVRIMCPRSNLWHSLENRPQ